MRLVTWNVNSIRARAERVGAWIDRQQPDVLCLQETRCSDEDFPRDLFEDRGYAVEIFGQPGRNGVCIAAREGLDFKRVSRGLPDEGVDADKRVIVATVGGLRVINVYVVNGESLDSEKYPYKLDWMARLGELLESEIRSCVEPVVCLGDFNIAPEDRDTWKPPQEGEQKILCSDKERALWRGFLDAGLHDLHRHFTDEEVYTFWDYRRLGFQKNNGWRIDHVLAALPAVGCARSVEVDREERKGKQPSDHAPVIATFEM